MALKIKMKQALLEKHIEDIEELKKLIKDMENEKT